MFARYIAMMKLLLNVLTLRHKVLFMYGLWAFKPKGSERIKL
jgi:hypothetical protein